MLIPQVREALRREYGKRVSRKKAARLMWENGLNARRRGKFIPTTNSNHGIPVCENLLNREFHAEWAGEKWVSDITYLRTTSGWVYLTAVLDLYDRKVIGWALSADMEAVHTTIPALEMAVAKRPAQGWPHLSFGPGSAVLRQGFSRSASGAMSHDTPGYEPQGELLG
ncbi:MAG: DDE-type integrase/transposase/recombinase [Spirochaetaceae bacterium]|jgi:transposase InsO family protein|nr:DDE-type integrase/transposase/recombinase [Spirochaetaceae bacterium]